MIKQMQAIQEMIKGLEQQYEIDIIRVYHETNQIQLTGEKGFGKLPVEKIEIIENYVENRNHFSGTFEGTEFIYLERKEEEDANN